jgi:hypothetical protein
MRLTSAGTYDAPKAQVQKPGSPFEGKAKGSMEILHHLSTGQR